MKEDALTAFAGKIVHNLTMLGLWAVYLSVLFILWHTLPHLALLGSIALIVRIAWRVHSRAEESMRESGWIPPEDTPEDEKV